MTDYDQIAKDCVNPVLLAAITERKEQYIYEGYVRWGLVERHIIEHIAAALRAAHEAGVAAERERCAGIAGKKASEAHARKSARSVWRALACEEVAAAIRKGES